MSALVMLHGWGMNALVFDDLRAHLGAEHAVFALDLPGYGEDAPDIARDTASVMERISAKAPPHCSVLGWSLGAQVALAWARAHPEQVERVVLVAATPCFVERADWLCAMERQVFADFEAALTRDSRATLARFTALQAQGDDDARATLRSLRAVLDARALPSAPVLAAGLRDLRENDLRAGLSAIAQPALVIHGERDGLVPPAAAQFLAGALPGGRLAMISGASHAPFVAQPARVAQHVRQFLA